MIGDKLAPPGPRHIGPTPPIPPCIECSACVGCGPLGRPGCPDATCCTPNKIRMFLPVASPCTGCQVCGGPNSREYSAHNLPPFADLQFDAAQSLQLGFCIWRAVVGSFHVKVYPGGVTNCSGTPIEDYTNPILFDLTKSGGNWGATISGLFDSPGTIFFAGASGELPLVRCAAIQGMNNTLPATCGNCWVFGNFPGVTYQVCPP